MASFSSDAELERLLRREAKRALKIAERKAEEDMFEEVGNFYAGGEPKKYERTGQMMDTPKTRKLSDLSFEAYLDDSGGYTTGKHPSMADVLELTNEGRFPGLRPAVGSKNYWNRAERKILKHADEAFKSVFN